MKLTKQDILNIDAYLKKKDIKFTDIRFELIDHLVSEYESMENYPDLESFLRKRTVWCRSVAEKKAKSVHWGYQKDLWKRLWELLKSPWFCLPLLILGFIIVQMESFVDANLFQKILTYPFIGIIIIQFFYFFVSQYRAKQKLKLLSSQYLLNIFSLPHIFLSFLGLVITWLKDHPYAFAIYIGISLLLNIAALSVVVQKRKIIAKEYHFLKAYFL